MGSIDANGFLKEGVPEHFGQFGNPRPMQKRFESGLVKDSRALDLQQNSNCWICEGWQEVHFIYTPGMSDETSKHDIYTPIELHLEIDEFKPDLLLP